ncbi:TetR/AcrR family transcriptional regulator [Aminivibrio sp.]|uniref:TetR/AcrR family transcriptional regulator n=1 Tax=Aminivibrio sp. TaxID=1872489 RepID=UPI001A62F0A7|nr:TetR/AcrR family transcriptional regulator [Aminivibrio sp.]MBL3539332.1 TetR/AcrR family transcriptional regulator [Aminivibrio sp.]
MRYGPRKIDDEKRAALIEAAMEEIAANGIDGASYNRIIERSGLSKGVVYYYFDNKDSLYLTVLDEVERQFLSSVGELKMPETREEFWTACRLYYEKAVRYGAGNLGIVKVVRNLIEPGTGMKGSPEFRENFRKVERWTANLLKRGQELGAIRKDVPPDLLRSVLQAMGHTMDSWLFENLEKAPGTVCIERFLAFALDMYERILSPEGTEEACQNQFLQG